MIKPLTTILLFSIFFITGMSCKKLVEDKKRDLLVESITNGRWYIETFEQGSVSLTSEFKGYDFQFDENGTISSFKDSLRSSDGTWTPDIQNYSITSNFPDANDPVRKLNGTWKIMDSDTGYVVAEMISEIGKSILHLRKNP